MADLKITSMKGFSRYVFFFSIPLISLIMVEYAARGDLGGIFFWATHEFPQFGISLVLFYAIYVFLWVNINHRGIAALSFSGIWIIISCIAGCKREILGTTLMPWDIALGSNIAGFINPENVSQFLFLIDPIFLLLIAVNILIIATTFVRLKGKVRSVKFCNICTIVSCILVAAIIFMAPKVTMADASTICEKNGYLRGFIVSAVLWTETYSADAAATNLLDEYQYDFKEKKATTGTKPNVIFIMSEAFWDITKVSGLEFSEDPLPNLHALANEGIYGEMVSPAYGGLTDNVEFEVMTGFSLKYLPVGTNAYMTSIKTAIPALPCYFKNMGYQTLAVHPYEEIFFNRHIIYPMLGIDNFVTEEDMKTAKTKGAYISDDFFADTVIAEYEQAAKPVFMYNISMQNHWPYTTENYYDEYEIGIESKKDLDAASMTALQNYTQGVHDADASLKKIIDYFRTVKEPTVIIFLGDHLPSLTGELDVYKKLGYVDESVEYASLFSLEETASAADGKTFYQNLQLLKTPYLIWANYQMPKEKGETLSANYLGVYTLSKIGLPLPPFYNFLLDYAGKVPINRYNLSVDVSGMPFTETPAAYDNYESIYETIQNNMLFGDQSQCKLFQIDLPQ